MSGKSVQAQAAVYSQTISCKSFFITLSSEDLELKNIIYFIGTFIFGAAPLAYNWVHESNKVHIYNLSHLLYSPEGWIFCITLATAVLIDTAYEPTVGIGQFVIAVCCVGLLGFASFEYSEMLTDIGANKLTYIEFWAQNQGHFIFASISFASLVKLTQRFRIGPTVERYPWN